MASRFISAPPRRSHCIVRSIAYAGLVALVAFRASPAWAQSVDAGAPASAQSIAAHLDVQGAPARGAADALVTVVLYGDLRDVFTRRANAAMAELRQRLGNDLRFVWRFHHAAAQSDESQLAARAAIAAHAQGRFWEMHDRLIAHTARLAQPDVERMAQSIALDLARFRTDLAAPTTTTRLAADQRLSRSAGHPDIAPTLYVNGTRIIGAHEVERYLPLVQAARSSAAALAPRDGVYARAVAAPVADPEGIPEPAAGMSRVRDRRALYRVEVQGQPSFGPPDALVTIVAFEDFQCPACNSVEPVLAEMRRRFGADLRIVWRNLPLWVHPDAFLAAEAAMEAYAQRGDQGFWRFHDALYSNFGRDGWLARAALERVAREQGLDGARFRQALDRHLHADRVRADARLASRLGFTGTPSFVINGRPTSGVMNAERFAEVIETARAAAAELVRGGVARTQVFERITANARTEVAYLPAAPDAPPGTIGEPLYPVDPRDDGPTLGGRNARVVVDFFGELEGMASVRAWDLVSQIARAYGARVLVRWRDAPTSDHANAMLAAEAAREVMAQRGAAAFWRFRETLHAHQEALSRPDLERYATALRIDLVRLRRALDEHTHQAAIRRDVDALRETGARADVPALFVNGRLVRAGTPLDAARHIVDAALTASAARGGAQSSAASPATAGSTPRATRR